MIGSQDFTIPILQKHEPLLSNSRCSGGMELVSGQKLLIGHTTQCIKPVDKEEISEIAKPWIFINLFFQHYPTRSPSSSELLNVRASRNQEALMNYSLSTPPLLLISLYYISSAAITRKQQAAKGQLLKFTPWVSGCHWYRFEWELHLPLLRLYFTWKAHNSFLQFRFKNFEVKLGTYQWSELLYQHQLCN